MFTRQLFLVLTAVWLSGSALCARAQQLPVPPPTAPEEPPPASATAPNPNPPPRHSRAPVGFLVRGTVFDQVGYAIPGAELHFRRSGEKKFRWSTNANSRGEFAIRVPPGNQYEVVVQSKGFSEATQPVNAANGLDEESLVVRLAPVAGRKK